MAAPAPAPAGLAASSAGQRDGMPELPLAAQPDIVLAAQKDAHYRREMRSRLAEAGEVALGPHMAVALQPELKLAAEMCYFGLTTLRGRQTPGEEYCDIFLVTERREAGRLPRAAHRAVLLLLGVVAPYVSKRLQAGGWKPLWAAFQRPKSARERAEELRRQMLARSQRQAQRKNREDGGGGDDESDEAPAQRRSYLAQLMLANKSLLASALTWANFLYRAHLAMFYLNGKHYDWSKRMAGVRYSFTREPRVQRPSYAVLGWFLLTQLALEALPGVRSAMRSVAAAWGIVSAETLRAARAAPASEGALVACLEPATGGDNDTIVAKERAGHERGARAVKCGICLATVTACACPPCGHLYCYEHIMAAVAARGECPLCRRECAVEDVQCVYFSL